MKHIVKQKKKNCLFYNYYYTLYLSVIYHLFNLIHEILLQRAAFLLLYILLSDTFSSMELIQILFYGLKANDLILCFSVSISLPFSLISLFFWLNCRP